MRSLSTKAAVIAATSALLVTTVPATAYATNHGAPSIHGASQLAANDVEVAQRKTLGVKLQYQQQSNWCWATTGLTIIQYLGHGKNASQNDYCKAGLGHRGGQCPNKTGDLSHVQRGARHFGAKPGQRARQLSFSQVKQNIDNNSPMPVGYHWTAGGGHMVGLIGYSNSQDVLINNSLQRGGGQSWMKHSHLVRNREWSWSETITGMAGENNHQEPPRGTPRPGGNSTVATSQNIDQLIAESRQRPVVFMLSTQTCGHCRNLKPRLDRLAREYNGKFLFAYADVTRDKNLQRKITRNSIQGYPTTVAWKDGREFKTMVGDKKDAGTKQFIDSVVGGSNNGPTTPPPGGPSTGPTLPWPGWPNPPGHNPPGNDTPPGNETPGQPKQTTTRATSSNIDQLIAESKDRPVVFMLSTQTCGHCRNLKPRLERLAREYNGKFLFAYADVTSDKNLQRKITRSSIQGYPTTVAWKNGREAKTMVGDKKDAGTRQFIESVVGQAYAGEATDVAAAAGDASVSDADRVANFFASMAQLNGDSSVAANTAVTAQDMGVTVAEGRTKVYTLNPEFVAGTSEEPAKLLGEAQLATAGDQKAVMIYTDDSGQFSVANSGDADLRYTHLADGGTVFVEPQIGAYYRVADGQVTPLNDAAKTARGDATTTVADYQEYVKGRYGDKLAGSSYVKEGRYGGF